MFWIAFIVIIGLIILGAIFDWISKAWAVRAIVGTIVVFAIIYLVTNVL